MILESEKMLTSNHKIYFYEKISNGSSAVCSDNGVQKD